MPQTFVMKFRFANRELLFESKKAFSNDSFQKGNDDRQSNDAQHHVREYHGPHPTDRHLILLLIKIDLFMEIYAPK